MQISPKTLTERDPNKSRTLKVEFYGKVTNNILSVVDSSLNKLSLEN